MDLNKFSDTLMGTAELEISGVFTEKLINALSAAGIAVLRMRKSDDYTLRLTVYQRDAQRVTSAAERLGFAVTERSRRGGSVLRALIKRRALIIALCSVAAALIMLSGLFIWDVEIYGAKTISTGRLLRELDECGVGIGKCYLRLDNEIIKDEMLLKESGLAWLTVNVRGSRAVVEVLERQAAPELYGDVESADILAAKDGVVRRVSVLNGSAAVEPGQEVHTGDVLISSIMDSITATARRVRAAGSVTADTSYELVAQYPADSCEKSYTQPSHSRFALSFGVFRVNLYLGAGKDVDECDKIIYNYNLGVEGLFTLPVTLVREELRPYELRRAERQFTDSERALLLAELNKQCNGETLSISFASKAEQGRLYAMLTARCREDIAKESAYT